MTYLRSSSINFSEKIIQILKNEKSIFHASKELNIRSGSLDRWYKCNEIFLREKFKIEKINE